MAILFLDSSAIVKRYTTEIGSAWVSNLIAPSVRQNVHSIHVSLLSGVEVVAALTRRQRIGSLSAQDAAQAITTFQNDWDKSYETIDVNKDVIRDAMDLAQRYALRGYDAVQLASALEASSLAQQFQQPFTFISADDKLNAAAEAEGLQIENPNDYP